MFEIMKEEKLNNYFKGAALRLEILLQWVIFLW